MEFFFYQRVIYLIPYFCTVQRNRVQNYGAGVIDAQADKMKTQLMGIIKSIDGNLQCPDTLQLQNSLKNYASKLLDCVDGKGFFREFLCLPITDTMNNLLDAIKECVDQYVPSSTNVTAAITGGTVAASTTGALSNATVAGTTVVVGTTAIATTSTTVATIGATSALGNVTAIAAGETATAAAVGVGLSGGAIESVLGVASVVLPGLVVLTGVSVFAGLAYCLYSKCCASREPENRVTHADNMRVETGTLYNKNIRLLSNDENIRLLGNDQKSSVEAMPLQMAPC